jgi:hypothetical protein
METVGLISAGIVIGLLGTSFLPRGGRGDVGLATTAAYGVFGVLVGWYTSGTESGFRNVAVTTTHRG